MTHEITSAIPCACVSHCGALLTTVYEGFGEDPRQMFVEFRLDYHGGSLRARARAALRILRGKDPWLHEVILYAGGVEKLQAALKGTAA